MGYMGLKQVLSSKLLLIIWIISWGISFIIEGIISEAFRTLGTIVLLMAIVSFFRERKSKRQIK